MSLHQIKDVAELHRHLQAALQLEHATIPPYLTALYSIHPGTNTDAYHILRAVAVEEMLHLTLAANVVNAVGGKPDLTAEGFVPLYPAYLPDGESDFQVNCEAFSRSAMDTFLKIERPASAAGEGVLTVNRESTEGSLDAGHVHDDSEEHFYSIGEFYQAIDQALVRLHAEKGDALFNGDPKLQVTPEYYYSGGGEIVVVNDLDSARAALRLISEQGEGLGGAIFDHEGEISHYYRFEQLLLGRYYVEGDAAGKPTGTPLTVDWDAVYPVKANARVSDYSENAGMAAAAAELNSYYADFLALLNRSYNGEPQLLIPAVGGMFRIKELMYRLMQQPINGHDGAHGAPTFEVK
jgi:hypothetical protein